MQRIGEWLTWITQTLCPHTETYWVFDDGRWRTQCQRCMWVSPGLE